MDGLKIPEKKGTVLSEVFFLVLIIFGFGATNLWGIPTVITLLIYTSAYLFTYLLRPLKAARVPILSLCIARVLFLLMKPVPLLMDWPFDLYIVVGVLWFTLKKLGVDFTSEWNMKFSKAEWISFVVIVSSSIVCLSVYFFKNRDIAQTFPLPPMPGWALPFVIVAVAVVNALREELLYRVVLQRTFSTYLSVSGAIFLQALAFGFLHFKNGFPQGWIGVGLTFLFGVAVGIQYRWSKSISLVWLTHSVTDAAMFTIILINR